MEWLKWLFSIYVKINITILVCFSIPFQFSRLPTYTCKFKGGLSFLFCWSNLYSRGFCTTNGCLLVIVFIFLIYLTFLNIWISNCSFLRDLFNIYHFSFLLSLNIKSLFLLIWFLLLKLKCSIIVFVHKFKYIFYFFIESPWESGGGHWITSSKTCSLIIWVLFLMDQGIDIYHREK